MAGAALVLSTDNQVILGTTNDTENREIKVSLGSSLKLFCCLNVSASGRCHVSWHFEPSEKNQTDTDTEKKIYNRTERICTLDSQCSNISSNLSNINEGNVGWYYCKVQTEIPILHIAISSKVKVICK